MNDLVTEQAEDLRTYATHFAHRDWNYTRVSPIKRIQYDYDDNLKKRIGRSLRYIFHKPPKWLDDELRSDFLWRLRMAAHVLRPNLNEPDGVLDNGNIITNWEETAEYLQFVQPTVGEMFAEWMMAEPDNPHAIKIAKEMKRIQDSYAKRIANGEVDGEARAAESEA